jgi:hypothetical protein
LKKAILGTLASIIALAMLLPLAVAVGQPGVTSDVTPEVRPALAIKAPEVAGVGQLVTIKVVEENTGKPVPRAGVWAVDVNDLQNETNDAGAYASIAEKYGQFLGWTDRDGNVFHRFREPGRYVLVAVKDGFIPGFAQIAVKPLKALAIRAPDVAGVGELVTITVYERYIGIPVPGAGVWAVDVNRIESARNDVEAYASLAEKYGEFLGWTDRNGNVFHRFSGPGQYVLVAVKDGLIPGFAQIAIKPLKALAIRAPDVARVGQLVTITVVEKYVGVPVAKAGVWAVEVKDIRNDTNNAEAYISVAEKCGHFLGWTDDNGNVFHRFNEAGRYVLVAVKHGLIPGFHRITILSLQPVSEQPVGVIERASV